MMQGAAIRLRPCCSMLAHASQLDTSTFYKKNLTLTLNSMFAIVREPPSYATLPDPLISKNRQITVALKMTTNDDSGVICLVNGFPRHKDINNPSNWCSAVLYFEKENLATFSPLKVPSKPPQRVEKSAEGYISWEDRVEGMPVCKTIRSPLWAVLSCRR